ncbi:MAG: DUF2894 domain-containing protein [Sandaracinaceae bacterium]|nr:DUF2894 domain-containing protein [Myxococcales bacterium]MCB9660691.1 DUF2894 domain-containing protein [Sandaracinaceae bacterium]
MSDAALDPAALRATLDELVVRGVEVWDAPGAALVRTLLTKAEGLTGVARAHLLKRANARLVGLTQDFERARERAGQTYAQLARQGLDPAKRLDGALQYGRFDEVERAARRYDETRIAARRAIVQPWLERLSQEAQARGLSQPPPPPDTEVGLPSPSPERETVTGLAAAIYQDAAADATARLVVAQARTELPEHAGRYHAPSVAARALEALDQLAPAYLRVQVARLEAIGALQRWVVPPPPEKPSRAKAKGKSPKGKKGATSRAQSANAKGASRSKPASDDAPAGDDVGPNRDAMEAAE